MNIPAKCGQSMNPFDSPVREPKGLIVFFLLLPSIDDALEVSHLEGSATDEATVNVNLREELLGVAGLAATTVEDRHVLSSFSTELLSDGCADEGMHVLSLVSCSSLASTDSPNGFVSEDDVRELFCSQVKE